MKIRGDTGLLIESYQVPGYQPFVRKRKHGAAYLFLGRNMVTKSFLKEKTG